MTREERQIYKTLEDFKRYAQQHIEFSPMALSNFHHLSDRLLDKQDGSERNFNKNIKDMLKNGVKAKTKEGRDLILALNWYVRNKRTFREFDIMFL